MAYKSAMRPACRYCRKPIAKETFTYFLRAPEPGVLQHFTLNTSFCRSLMVDAYPETKQEAQRLVNQSVVSVKRGFGASKDRISQFSTWDGESRCDEFFCSGKCAKSYAYRMARLAKDRETLAK